MNVRRLLPLVLLAGVVAGAVACAEDLNPQPLPPADNDDGSSGTSAGGEHSPGSSSGGSSGSTGGVFQPDPDAGTDAGDAQ